MEKRGSDDQPPGAAPIKLFGQTIHPHSKARHRAYRSQYGGRSSSTKNIDQSMSMQISKYEDMDVSVCVVNEQGSSSAGSNSDQEDYSATGDVARNRAVGGRNLISLNGRMGVESKKRSKPTDDVDADDLIACDDEEKAVPCPRCHSVETKFCYFNNYNVNQPRHYCRKCGRFWTSGGSLRDVPVGAGRRKNKQELSSSLLPQDTFDAPIEHQHQHQHHLQLQHRKQLHPQLQQQQQQHEQLHLQLQQQEQLHQLQYLQQRQQHQHQHLNFIARPCKYLSRFLSRSWPLTDLEAARASYLASTFESPITLQPCTTPAPFSILTAVSHDIPTTNPTTTVNATPPAAASATDYWNTRPDLGLSSTTLLNSSQLYPVIPLQGSDSGEWQNRLGAGAHVMYSPGISETKGKNQKAIDAARDKNLAPAAAPAKAAHHSIE